MKNQLWSEELQEQTLNTLEDLLTGMFIGKNCHMKKKTENDTIFGHIKNDPALMTMTKPLLKIASSDNGKEWIYKSIKEVIEDRWAVD